MTPKPKDIRGTRTEQRVVRAYIGESCAYTRYTFYANQAKKDDYPTIAIVFQNTANNELRHAKVFFKMLQGGKVDENVTIDAGIIGTTAENLATAADEEHTEGVEEYRLSAKIAREEGFDEIADHFEAIASVEEEHETRFRYYLDLLNKGMLYKREEAIDWQCLVCGYIHHGTTPPEECPACDHPQKYYMPVHEQISSVVE